MNARGVVPAGVPRTSRSRRTLAGVQLAGALLGGTILTAVASVPLSAQSAPARRLFLVPKGDSVLVYLVDAPPPLGGFVVYRGAPGTELQRVTAEPIEGAREPAIAAGMLGADLQAVMQAVRATDDAEVFRRLHSDPFAGPLLSLLYRNVAVALGRFHADSGLAAGAELEYRIVFTDGAGRETDRTLGGRVVVGDVAPTVPTGVTTEAGNREVTVAWSFPPFRSDADDFTIGFHVYRAVGGGDFQRLTIAPILRDEAAPLTFRDADVVTGGAYRYRVTALDIGGRESAPSAVSAVDVPDRVAPAVPSDLAVQPGDGAVLLVWRMSPEPDVAGYHVERSEGLSIPYARLTSALVPAAEPSFADSTVTGGRPYVYRVLAVDSAGNVSEPSNSLTALPVDDTPPAPPGPVTVSLVERRALLKWEPSPSGDVLGYFVYRRLGSDGAQARLTSRPVEATELADSGYVGGGLVPGRTYTISVAAVDSSFNESESISAVVTLPDDEAPSAVTGMSARNRDGRFVEILWSASAALDVESYLVTRESGDGAWVDFGRFPASGRATRDTTVTAGRRYAYRVVAIDSVGNASEPVADSVAFGDLTPPSPPRLVTAVTGAEGVDVTWERVASTDLAGYVVFRSTLPTGVYERLTVDAVAELSFRDPAGGPQHFYQVRAIDTSGNLSAPSPAAGVVRQ